MTKFRKKPVIVDAWLIRDILNAVYTDWNSVPEPVRNLYDSPSPLTVGGVVFMPNGMYIPTLEGNMYGDAEDMLIRGVQGEFYPCKPDIFEQTYEKVDSDD